MGVPSRWSTLWAVSFAPKCKIRRWRLKQISRPRSRAGSKSALHLRLFDSRILSLRITCAKPLRTALGRLPSLQKTALQAELQTQQAYSFEVEDSEKPVEIENCRMLKSEDSCMLERFLAQ